MFHNHGLHSFQYTTDFLIGHPLIDINLYHDGPCHNNIPGYNIVNYSCMNYSVWVMIFGINTLLYFYYNVYSDKHIVP